MRGAEGGVVIGALPRHIFSQSGRVAGAWCYCLHVKQPQKNRLLQHFPAASKVRKKFAFVTRKEEGCNQKKFSSVQFLIPGTDATVHLCEKSEEKPFPRTFPHCQVLVQWFAYNRGKIHYLVGGGDDELLLFCVLFFFRWTSSSSSSLFVQFPSPGRAITQWGGSTVKRREEEKKREKYLTK